MTTPGRADRTDSVETKLRLLKTAYDAGRHDLAMSLAVSIKDSLEFERQLRVDGPPHIKAGSFVPVEKLPAALARWAHGWAYCQPVTLFETVDVPRTAEPVEVSVEFATDQLADPFVDLAREVRVARWDTAARQLREIPSQLLTQTRVGRVVRCQLLFFADIAAHESAQLLIFYGNPHAELPEYASDLQVVGAGYGLDIGNRHYLARLSRQTGQLERLTYRREHGLELYAGGKGHGEPPDIDWGHDYVDQGHFQKLRMRNWSHCPNYEVIRGPLAVQVRRWGFPHSPVHPLFTPSRMHMDIGYTFYAGLPYFVKQGRMEMVQDFPIAAMRDDEWVFSGYSFTDMVWIDGSGRLHDGPVPPEQNDSLWGVGFYNRVSRDAFIALRLEHAAEGFDKLPHGGAPTLHYAGHGQLWSRYPADQAQMKAGAWVEQKNAYLLSPYPEQDAATQIQATRHRLLNPPEIRDELPSWPASAAAGAPPLARYGETPETAGLKPAIWKVLREVQDEQLYATDANIVDLGYVYDVRERDGTVRVVVTMPHRGRPVYQFLEWQGGGRVQEGIREQVLRIDGVRDVVVDFTWDPPWSQARLSEQGRRALGLLV
jgi:metal-sulfur cluster biosynthetic enzyme